MITRIEFDPTNADDRNRVRAVLSAFEPALVAASPAEAVRQLDAALAALPEAETPAPKVEKRGRPKKVVEAEPVKTEPAKVETAPVEPPAPEVDTLADPIEAAPAAKTEPAFVAPVLPEQPTKDTVRAAVSKVGGTPGLGRERAIAIMKEFGKADKFPDINPLLFANVQHACAAALAEKGLVL